MANGRGVFDGLTVRDVIQAAILMGGLLVSYLATTNTLSRRLDVVIEQLGSTRASVERLERRSDQLESRVYELNREVRGREQ